MATRYETDRALGYRDESVLRGRKNYYSKMAAEAEDWFARTVGQRGQGDIGHRDPGWDVDYRGWHIDVKWSTSGLPRRYTDGVRLPELRVPKWKPLKADIYTLVMGLGVEQFEEWAWMNGWAYRREVLRAPVLDLGRKRESSGKAAPFYCLEFDRLRPPIDLVNIEPK